MNKQSVAQATGTKIEVLDRAQFGNTTTTTSITLSESNNFNSIRLRGASATINDVNGVNLKIVNNTNLTLQFNSNLCSENDGIVIYIYTFIENKLQLRPSIENLYCDEGCYEVFKKINSD